jgi:hypothetical protein
MGACQISDSLEGNLSWNFVSLAGLGGYKNSEGDNAMLSTILIVVLILLLLGALPTWPYSASWGYAPEDC